MHGWGESWGAWGCSGVLDTPGDVWGVRNLRFYQLHGSRGGAHTTARAGHTRTAHMHGSSGDAHTQGSSEAHTHRSHTRLAAHMHQASPRILRYK
eukprot:scaffold4017_cov140-Isochrysis_galbana.AAC.3